MGKLVINKGRNAFVICVRLKGTKYSLSELRGVEGLSDLHQRTPDRKVGAGQNFSSEEIKALAGKAVYRRLNRMERVTLSFNGKITRRTSAGLLIAFETCNDAVLAACEIQRRCAGLPQMAENHLFVNIGLHKASPEMSSINPDKLLERRNPRRRFGFDIAGQLASMAETIQLLYQALCGKCWIRSLRNFACPCLKAL